jgi:hypothetical protein
MRKLKAENEQKRKGEDPKKDAVVTPKKFGWNPFSRFVFL